MTWIVGMSTMFGFAVALSDVRVTFRNGQEMDCLQKIYPVGHDIALGFAGSVSIGFAMVSRLTALLSGAGAGTGWDPSVVAECWPAEAKKLFGDAAESEKALGSHLMMLSAHPTENLGALPLPRSYVHIFRSPDFTPVSLPSHQVESIGCGAVNQACAQALERFANNDDSKVELMKAAGMMPSALAATLGHSLMMHVTEAEPLGISPHFNTCFVTRRQIRIGTNDVTRFDKAGPTEFRMPRLAQSLDELHAIVGRKGSSADRCVALGFEEFR